MELKIQFENKLHNVRKVFYLKELMNIINFSASSCKSSINEDIIYELAEVVRYNYEIDTSKLRARLIENFP